MVGRRSAYPLGAANRTTGVKTDDQSRKANHEQTRGDRRLATCEKERHAKQLEDDCDREQELSGGHPLLHGAQYFAG